MRRLKHSISLLAVLLLALAGLAAESGFATSTNAVVTERLTWHDARRDREVPVKIYSPTNRAGPFPVIIFSHGLGGTRDGYQYLGEYWAARGYVSVHVQHHGSDDAVWRDAGLFNAKSAMRKAAANPNNAINRVMDISFVIDELERLNRKQQSSVNQLDLSRIGVAGHSFGAYTALAVAGQVFNPGLTSRTLADPRVKAVIPMSAPAPANQHRLDEVYAGIHTPCLHMTGTRDHSPIGDTTPEERRIPFDHCRHSDQYLLTFQDGDHAIFSGRRRPSKQERGFQELICLSSTAFWETYLLGKEPARQYLTNDFRAVLGRNGTFEIRFPQ